MAFRTLVEVFASKFVPFPTTPSVPSTPRICSVDAWCCTRLNIRCVNRGEEHYIHDERALLKRLDVYGNLLTFRMEYSIALLYEFA